MPVAVASSGDIEAALRDLGRQLRARRKAAGLTQEQLAERIGYARPTLSMAETGRRRSPDFWRRVDDELSAGRTFTKAYGDIEAMAGARLLPPLRPGEDSGGARTVTAPGRWPHCHREIPLAAQITLSVAG